MGTPSFQALSAANVDRRVIPRYLSKNVPIACAEWVDPATASANAIKLAIASVAAPVVYSGTQFDGAIGQLSLGGFGRNLTVTTAGVTPADAPANAVITGTDVDGKVISETITVAQTATIALGVKLFLKVTSISLPAGEGTAATLAFGFGAVLGLPYKIQTRGGGLGVVKEIVNGAIPGTAGTFTTPATAAPNGSYTPNSAPNATNDYALYFERDISAGL